MRCKDPLAISALILTAVLLAASGLASLLLRRPEVRRKPLQISAVLDIASLSDTSRSLMFGYQYHLLQRFAADNGQRIDIRSSAEQTDFLDSLRAGALDIVVIPFADSVAVDSVLVSTPVDSLTLWLMRADNRAGMEELEAWIAKWHASEERIPTRERFLRSFNAFRSKAVAQVSPYDSLIRTHSDSLGFDWHLLASVIYLESRFHIEARSRQGATGLMQMMPGTARHYGVTDPLDPEMNIAAGARLLGNLIQRHSSVAQDMGERYKYALAAYNAGIGRIDDCIALARHLGVDPGSWSNITARVLPLMADEEILESGVVKMGPFKGVQTAAYVDYAITVYERLCRICP